jgi:serine/threonine protein kinase
MPSELSPVAEDLGLDRTLRGLVNDQQVFGRYLLREVLGRGGMGVVWLGYDQRLDREVALKFLPDEINFDAAALDELKRETRRCLDLTHPNIIRIYDFNQDKQAAAISMEYVDGKTLAELRVEKSDRIFDVDEIKGWIAQACTALHYAHRDAGVVHRDLKPANLMLTSRRQIKIADFGIAQSMGDSITRMTMRRGTSGTLAYMSPQQLGGEPASVSDDVYAMGTTIYELLTSKPPFYTGDISFQVRTTIPQKIADRRREFEIRGKKIPREWEEAVAACLEKSPEARPINMLDLAERLGLSTGMERPPPTVKVMLPAMATRTVEKKAPFSSLRRSLTFPKIEPRAALLAGVAIVVLAAIVGFFRHPAPGRPVVILPVRDEVRLSSNPPGAKVHVDGLPDRTTPATFTALPAGHYEIVLSAENFDSVKRVITISDGAKIDLGTISLPRSVGELDLETTPTRVHYVVENGAGTEDFHQEGSTPDVMTALPSGTYRLTFSDSALPPVSETVAVAAHGTKKEKADLILLSVLQGASPAPASVLRGEMDASRLDDQGKNELVDLLKRAFAAYLNRGFLAAASDQITRLQGLGQDVSPFQDQLSQARFPLENEVIMGITNLLTLKKFATAEVKLRHLDGVVEKETADRLNAQFQPLLNPYRQQIDAAIAAARSLSPPIACRQLKMLATRYPDELRLQLALAETQTRMPPDQDRLTTRLKNLHQFEVQNNDFAGDVGLVAMEAAYTSELNELETLENALAAAKQSSGQLERLREEKEIIEQRRVGRPQTNPFAQAVNFFGKVVVGHSVVNTASYFSSREEKEEAIDDIQQKIEAAEASLSQPESAREEARMNYDAFMAHVPWGQDEEAAQKDQPAASQPASG